MASELKAVLEEILAACKTSDAERLIETQERHDEAERWKDEGDMYGWNFHEGVSAGCTTASIIFHRVRRLVEQRLEEELAKNANQPSVG